MCGTGSVFQRAIYCGKCLQLLRMLSLSLVSLSLSLVSPHPVGDFLTVKRALKVAGQVWVHCERRGLLRHPLHCDAGVCRQRPGAG